MAGDVSKRLQVDAASVNFGDAHVLGPLSFEVQAGECVVLLGPSGCGKSTLLAALAGLQELTSGKIWAVEATAPPGFVFQDPNLLPWLSAAQNVALPLELAKVAPHHSKARALAALDLVGMTGFANARPKTLSGGMAMRVALARAIVSQPKALLLDEPFGAVDELGRRALNDVVHKVKQEAGVAILFVTHSVEEAVYMGDRILVMTPRPGKISATLHVPDEARDADFLLSDIFARTVTLARRALAKGAGHEVT